MSGIPPQLRQAAQGALRGERSAAFDLLDYLAAQRRWSFETLRARWDGAAKFLTWWHTLEDEQPELLNVSSQHAQAFLDALYAEGLTTSTIRGYREGARAFLKYLYSIHHNLNEEHSYHPFKGTTLPRPPKASFPVDQGKLELESPKNKARLELLVALLNLG